MRLSQFIEDTMYEIALGVQRAQARAKDLVAINPAHLDGEPLREKSFVDFDVSVVVNDATSVSKDGGGKLGGEISVASIGKLKAELGGGADKTRQNSTAQTHRVAFQVPVYFNAHFRNNPATAEFAAEILGTQNAQNN